MGLQISIASSESSLRVSIVTGEISSEGTSSNERFPRSCIEEAPYHGKGRGGSKPSIFRRTRQGPHVASLNFYKSRTLEHNLGHPTSQTSIPSGISEMCWTCVNDIGESRPETKRTSPGFARGMNSNSNI
ncbi:hypothetical protein ElyMa_002290000 [Elysia marginata]|uniref:Uncharacterized protein n=1 Tax=Elysia marginata TaxID=1093978 RepID=A0AAV4G1X3_9GAST|nr:hypothetical protein ElyMa_002290000 [Elysia marginata]